jgi:hypothetical protein
MGLPIYLVRLPVFLYYFFRVPALLGPGAFARLGEAKVSLAKVDIVPLTHLHIVSAG